MKNSGDCPQEPPGTTALSPRRLFLEGEGRPEPFLDRVSRELSGSGVVAFGWPAHAGRISTKYGFLRFP